MQTEELIAGPTMNARVAEKVMRWHREGNTWVTADGEAHCDVEWLSHDDEPWSPSTDISAAWQVLDTMVWRVGTANIRLDMEDYGRGAMNDHGAERAVWVTIGEHTAFGPAPLAICRAALAAVKG